MGSLRKKVAGFSAMVGIMLAGMFVMAGAASATPADPGEEAFTTLGEKTTLYGGLALGVIITSILVLFVVKWIKRAQTKA